MTESLTDGFSKLIQSPASTRLDAYQRGMVRLTIAIQIATVVLLSLGLALRALSGVNSLLDRTVMILNIVLALCLYVFSRRGLYAVTNTLILVVGTAALFGLAVFEAPGYENAFYYLIILVLMTGLTSRPAMAISVFVLHLIGMTAVALIVPGYDLTRMVNGPLTFYMVGTPLLLVLLYTLNTVIRRDIIRNEADAAHYRMMFSEAYDGILLLHVNGTILDANETAARLYGYRREDLLRLSVRDLKPLDRQDQQPNRKYRFETISARADGTSFPLEVTQVPIRHEGGIARLAILRDISKQKQAQQAIEQYAIELEERNRELDAFTYTVAHDLKNPLNAVRGFAEIIEMVRDREEMVAENLTYMMRSINLMNNIINDLLMLSRLRHADEVIEPVDMTLAAYAAVERTHPQIEERGARVIIEGDLPQALGYMPWIETVFVNLIGNAVKYIGTDNPDPLVRIRAATHNGHLRYEVIDNGIGVDPGRADKLFELFERDNRMEADGTGLGLSIVKRIVTRLKGEAGIEPNPVKGSIFWFTLPPVA